MKLSGVLVVVQKAVQVNEDFRRRTFVLEMNDRGHIELISFELFQNHCSLIDTFKIGDHVTVDFDVKGRKWIDGEGVDKYFNTLRAWKLSEDKST